MHESFYDKARFMLDRLTELIQFNAKNPSATQHFLIVRDGAARYMMPAFLSHSDLIGLSSDRFAPLGSPDLAISKSMISGVFVVSMERVDTGDEITA